MNLNIFLLFFFQFYQLLVVSTNVVDLDSKSFEHLTQSSTGSTTGDWFIKFYAPWCGHCRKLEPIWEELADELHGVVNIARVDVPKSRDLGTRFAIKGFPTLLFFSKGKYYQYEGRRGKEELLQFARGGYVSEEAQDVPGPVGFFQDLFHIFIQAMKDAKKDFKEGKYITESTILLAVPFLALATVILIFSLTPAHQYEVKTKRKKRD